MKNVLFPLLILLMHNCTQQDANGNLPPERIQLVTRDENTDTLDTEPGIDAVENTNTEINNIQIMWHKHPDKNIKKYQVYRSEHESGTVNYSIIGNIERDQSGEMDTIFIDTQDLQLNVRYYYYVTAVSNDDLESVNSDTVSYKLIEKATLLGVNGNISEIKQLPLIFKWENKSGYTPAEYIIRIEAYISETIHPVYFIERFEPAEYSQPQNYLLTGENIKSVLPNGRYQWRVDCVGEAYPEENYYSGSESDWEIFTIEWE